ncbi:MAG: hypothetical protein ABI859_07555 [Pseudomonadota bacterium]
MSGAIHHYFGYGIVIQQVFEHAQTHNLLQQEPLEPDTVDVGRDLALRDDLTEQTASEPPQLNILHSGYVRATQVEPCDQLFMNFANQLFREFHQ